MRCKRCEKLDYQFRAHQYWERRTTDEMYRIITSIRRYYADNKVPNDERSFTRFIADHYGDYTIIESVTGFNG